MHHNTVIPEYILKDKELLIPCLRGLFDTDGSVSLCRTTLQIYFSNHSRSLLESFNEGLKKLGFNPCLTKKGVILYAKQANRFCELIGTNNPKNATKIEMYKKVPK